MCTNLQRLPNVFTNFCVCPAATAWPSNKTPKAPLDALAVVKYDGDHKYVTHAQHRYEHHGLR